MTLLHYTSPVNPLLLAEQVASLPNLAPVGGVPAFGMYFTPTDVWINSTAPTFTPASISAIDAAVAAHDHTALSQSEQNAANQLAQNAAFLTAYNNAINQLGVIIAANPNNATLVQVATGLQQCATILQQLLKLLRSRMT